VIAARAGSPDRGTASRHPRRQQPSHRSSSRSIVRHGHRGIA
jgi:hypothetical protein